MVLAQNEEIIKEWQYATAHATGLDPLSTNCTITVTNKRVITETRNRRQIERQEANLSSIEAVNAHYRRKSRAPAIFCFILAVLFAVVGFVVLPKLLGSTAGILVGVVAAVIFVVIGILLLGKASFYIYFYTPGVYPISAGANNALKFKQIAMKVKVNNKVCQEIIDEIGAIISENK